METLFEAVCDISGQCKRNTGYLVKQWSSYTIVAAILNIAGCGSFVFSPKLSNNLRFVVEVKVVDV